MFLKKIYKNTLLTVQQLTEKNLLSKKIYNKFIIRNTLLNNKMLKVLDTGSNFFHSSVQRKTKFFSKKFKLKKNFINGRSFYGKNYSYTNQLNPSLHFKYFLAHERLSTVDLFSKLLNTKNTSFSTIIFLNPLKGGYRVYKSGIVGFLPNRHLIKFQNNDILNKIFISKQISLATSKIKTSKRRFKILKKNVKFKKRFLLKNLFLMNT